MKIRSQVGMVLNLDKCIGCHTCSVTCKTSGPAVKVQEYARFNNVETKPALASQLIGKTGKNGRAVGSVKSTVNWCRAWVTKRCCWVKFC